MDRKIRELRIQDIDLVINYFLNANDAFLKAMGVEPDKLPNADEWRNLLLEDFERPIEEKRFFYVLWEIDGTPVGHSNINKIIYEQEAYMHLHLWFEQERKNGNGTFFVQKSIERYFEKFCLKNLFCEPYAHNLAPNKTLQKSGFEFVKTYETTPGWINFHQPVNRWVLNKEKWQKIFTSKDRKQEKKWNCL